MARRWFLVSSGSGMASSPHSRRASCCHAPEGAASCLIAQNRRALAASLVARFSTVVASIANWGKYRPETALRRGPSLSTLAAERRSARVNGHARAAFPLLALTIEILPAFDARFVM